MVILLLTGCSSSSSSGSAVDGATHLSSSSAHEASDQTADRPKPGSSTAAAARSTVDPCTILTAAAIHTVFGGRVTAGVSAPAVGTLGPTCQFSTTGSVLGLGGDLLVLIDISESPAVVQDGQDGAPVAGVGDAATYIDQYGAPVLTFAKNSTVVDLELGAPHLPAAQTPADIKVLMIRVGKTAAARL